MIRGLIRHLRLWGSFVRVGFIADLEFRANFFLRLLADVFWYLAQIAVFESLFQYTSKIGSWNLEQTRIFLGIVFIVDGFYMILLSDNLDRFSENVRKGNLDLILAKPVNSQFIISTQKVATFLSTNLIVGFSYFGWALYHYPEVSWLRVLWLLLLVPVGVICLYSIRFMFASSAVLLTRAENLQYLWYQLYKLGLRPDSIYLPWMRYLLLSALPVGFVASVPARAVLGELEWQMLIWALVVAGSFLYASHRYWQFCLSKYTSASS